MKGVKEQLRMNRAEEKQRMLEEKNTNDENRKLIKMAGVATGPGAGGGKASFAGSGSTSPRRPSSSSSSSSSQGEGDDHGGETATQHGGGATHGTQRASNLTQANVQAHQMTAGRSGAGHGQQQQQQRQQRHQGGLAAQSHHSDPTSTRRLSDSKGAAASKSGPDIGGASKSSLVSHATGSKVSSVGGGSRAVAGHDVDGGGSVSGEVGTAGSRQRTRLGPRAGGSKGSTVSLEDGIGKTTGVVEEMSDEHRSTGESRNGAETSKQAPATTGLEE